MAVGLSDCLVLCLHGRTRGFQGPQVVNLHALGPSRDRDKQHHALIGYSDIRGNPPRERVDGGISSQM